MVKCSICGKSTNSKSYRCKECNTEYCRKYAQEHPEKYRAIRKKWRDKNKEYLNAYQLKRYHSNPNVKIARSFYSGLRKVIHGLRNGKRFVKKLGVETRAELLEHLKSTIPEGYTLSDYGSSLCVDHIKPLCAFDLTDEEQQKIAFHYTNTRLVLNQENLIKSGEDKKQSIQS